MKKEKLTFNEFITEARDRGLYITARQLRYMIYNRKIISKPIENKLYRREWLDALEKILVYRNLGWTWKKIYIYLKGSEKERDKMIKEQFLESQKILDKQRQEMIESDKRLQDRDKIKIKIAREDKLIPNKKCRVAVIDYQVKGDQEIKHIILAGKNIDRPLNKIVKNKNIYREEKRIYERV